MFQYMIDYICSHENIDSDVENFVDELKTLTIEIDVTNFSNFKDIIFSKSFVVVNKNFFYEIE